jgi:hypothetical protein
VCVCVCVRCGSVVSFAPDTVDEFLKQANRIVAFAASQAQLSCMYNGATKTSDLNLAIIRVYSKPEDSHIPLALGHSFFGFRWKLSAKFKELWNAERSNGSPEVFLARLALCWLGDSDAERARMYTANRGEKKIDGTNSFTLSSCMCFVFILSCEDLVAEVQTYRRCIFTSHL